LIFLYLLATSKWQEGNLAGPGVVGSGGLRHGQVWQGKDIIILPFSSTVCGRETRHAPDRRGVVRRGLAPPGEARRGMAWKTNPSSSSNDGDRKQTQNNPVRRGNARLGSAGCGIAWPPMAGLGTAW